MTISPVAARRVENFLVWGAPPLIIPAIHYHREHSKNKKTALIYDMANVSGSFVFLGMSWLTGLLLKPTMASHTKGLIQTAIGTAAFIPFASFIPNRIGRFLTKREAFTPKSLSKPLSSPMMSERFMGSAKQPRLSTYV